MSTKKIQRVLVTGASGFVGQHLVRGLCEAGYAVRVLARRTSDLSPLAGLQYEKVEGDLTDAGSLEGCCDGVDAVIHSACAVKGTFDAGRDAVQAFLRVNRDGTTNLAREVLKHDGLRLVHISSTAAMGSPKTTRVDETSPCYPKSPYQVSKREAELALLDLNKREGLNVVILRPCVVAGEGKRVSELLTLFKLVRKGRLPYIGSRYDIQKPIVMVDDLVSASILAMGRGDAGEIYLIHSDGGHTLGEIIATAGGLTGAKRTHIRIPVVLARGIAYGFKAIQLVAPSWNPPLTPERVDLFIADRFIDVSKARKELGYDPKYRDIEEILGRTYRWYVQEGLL